MTPTERRKVQDKNIEEPPQAEELRLKIQHYEAEYQRLLRRMSRAKR